MNWTPTEKQIYHLTGGNEIAKAPPTAVVYGLEDRKYREACGVSQSFLNSMDPTPAHASKYFEKSSDASHFVVGRAVHEAILPGGNPLGEYVIYPETYVADRGPDKGKTKPWNSNAEVCKHWYSEQVSNGLIPITIDERDEIGGTVDSMKDNPTVRRILEAGNSEVSLFAKLTYGQVEFIAKARPDWVPQFGSALFDIKTVRSGDSEKRKFAKIVKYEGYGFQAAFYMKLWNLCNPNDQKTRFCWIVVEKEFPFSIALYYPSDEEAARHEQAVESRLWLFAQCIQAGVFTGDATEFQEIT